ncbi:cell envelope integrity protein TolA [Herbaspirillum seropedicae]|uniref:TolA-related transport transmembrane protein n=1 Tax=Herbaspirillum seropedicae (strain SmR1) TaxID=757424 RepID=D8INR4_HERSS|nr:cell envelope integrity protein TolA [Herbaspirillum seropedicae]ADJ62734.1 TolA-related transport transmembrane protein [Herbaspirillum seropedicae SmR1]AKN64838.1 membrane protein TolA [Herbaspirillum seropedicae]AON53459.1 TolA-related transport transmembrane protein [Herbaspirillum seropedicae]NQE31378.1 membrane protein TolA [Herbaspirillum seropedicae]UMU20781.1 cell envelope integrity protein TolA [Herbaspirillum seropedicae]
MSDNAPYNIPKAPGRWRAITLALVMHVALFLFFWIGIRWQSETPLTVEAEIWDPQYKEAAPLPTPPEPQPQPVVEPPKPQPQPEPKPVPPKVIDEPKVEKPDIALQKEKERKRKEEQEKQEKLEKEKAEKLKAEKEKAEKEKAEREKKEKLEADKQKKLKEEKQKEDEAKKKADAEKQAADKKKQQQAAADAKAAEARRQEDLKRMMGQATSATGGTGTAEKSQGPKGSPNYANKLRAKIRSNTVFDNSGVSGNPAGEYTVELFPDGTVRSVRVNKPSGVPGFDEAVRTAVMKSQPFPPDTDNKVPSSFTFTHYPKDQ